ARVGRLADQQAARPQVGGPCRGQRARCGQGDRRTTWHPNGHPVKFRAAPGFARAVRKNEVVTVRLRTGINSEISYVALSNGCQAESRGLAERLGKRLNRTLS